MSTAGEVNGPYGETPEWWAGFDDVATQLDISKSGAHVIFMKGMDKLSKAVLRGIGEDCSFQSIRRMSESRHFQDIVEASLRQNLSETIARRNEK